MHCSPDDLFREVCDNHILQILREEKEAKISGGLYHELQVRMTYNSNHIEGSKLTEDQTRLIFETRTIDVGDGIPVDDIIETSNHFRAIDYVIDKALEPLSEDIIKHLHLLLKQGTKDSSLDWFAVGDYKKRANTVGGRETCKPNEVHKAMDKLVTNFNSKSNISIDDIIELHADFEYIHPFQDGNGRTGRMILFRECLYHGIAPFIIEDANRPEYLDALKSYHQGKDVTALTSLFQKEQEYYWNRCQYFLAE